MQADTGSRSCCCLSGKVVYFEAQGGAGIAFGYSVAITVDPTLAKSSRSSGAFGWGGAGGTVSWTDPKEELVGVIMVQQPT